MSRLLVALFMLFSLVELLPAQEKTLVLQENTVFNAEDVISQLAEITGKTYVVEEVLRQIKINLPGRVELDEFKLQAILEINDIVLVPTRDDETEVVKAYLQRNLMAREIGRPTRFFGVGDAIPEDHEIVTAALRIEHTDAEQVFAQIRAMMARDRDRLGNIVYLPGKNVLLVTDKASSLRYYFRLVEAVDVPGPTVQIRSVELQHASAPEVARLIEAAFDAAHKVNGRRDLQPATVVADSLSNRLVFVGIEEWVARAAVLAQELDVPPVSVIVVRLEHADAEETAETLTRLFAGAVVAVPDKRTETVLINAPLPLRQAALDAVRGIDVRLDGK